MRVAVGVGVGSVVRLVEDVSGVGVRLLGLGLGLELGVRTLAHPTSALLTKG